MSTLQWILLTAGYSAFEYWLGRTNLVKPNSALSAALHTLKAGLSVFRRKRK